MFYTVTHGNKRLTPNGVKMTAITIDTYALITSLKDAGFEESQAKATIDAVVKCVDTTRQQIEHDYKLDETASKRDLKELELILVSRIKDAEIKIEQSKSELTRWVIGAGFLQVALIGGLILKLADKI